MRGDARLKLDFSAVRGRKLLIALSGGADSVALTCLLADARESCRLTLEAAHLDHGIRPQSASDADFCRKLCHRLGIPFHTLRVDVPAEAAASGEGLETAARRLRHAWLHRVKAQTGADCIVLAHHMDDQAESVLMHLARGTGPEGICGMQTFSGDLYRPLLHVRKSELMDDLRRRGECWREDATNAIADTPRNLLRLRGIPAMEEAYPRFVPAVARYAAAAQRESDYLDKQTDVYFQRSATQYPFGTNLGLFPDLHPAILARAIRRCCGGEIRHERMNAVLALMEKSHGRAELNGRFTAERGHGCLWIVENKATLASCIPLMPNGMVRLDGLCEIHARPGPSVPVRTDPMRQALCALSLEGAVVRTRRNGDRFRPLGCGDRLLSDFLIDRKVDRPLRDCVALVAKGSRVLWVCGLGISEDAKLRDGDDALLLECRYSFDMPGLLRTEYRSRQNGGKKHAE